MRQSINIAYTLALAAFMTGCADYVDTSDFKVDKPESVTTYEYLKDYKTLNTYVDRTAHPNFKLGVAINASDYNNRSSIYAMACSNFDCVTPVSDMMYGSCVDGSGIFNLEPVRKLASYAKDGGTGAFGHSLVSNSQQNTSWLKSIETTAEASLGVDQMIVDCYDDYSQLNAFPYALINNFAPSITDGVLIANITNKKHQFYLVQDMPTEPGKTYVVTMKIRGSKDVNLTMQINNKDNTFKFPATVDWQEIKLNVTATSDKTSLIVDPGNLKVQVEIAYVDIRHQRALSEQEIKDLYNAELDRWIAGVMEACEGNVTDWDLMNCPIANSGSNPDGYYPLMSADNGPSSNFYWADLLGDIDFMKTAESLARKYFAEYSGNAADLHLYVNEDCYADSHKAESLVYWIDRWDKAGAKIDGIGTELHLDCPTVAADLDNVKSNVALNLSILARTGKLVRISALDITLKDETGASVAAADMTLDQRKAVGDLYQWVISQYFVLVPAAQQGGICLWQVIDSGVIPGLWNTALERTSVYASLADALEKSK